MHNVEEFIAFEETKSVAELVDTIKTERTELHLMVSRPFDEDSDVEAVEPLFLKRFAVVRKDVTRLLGKRPTRGTDRASWLVGDLRITLRVDQEDRGLPLMLLLSSEPAVKPAPPVSDLVPLVASLPRLLQLTSITLAAAVEFLEKSKWASNVSTILVASEKGLKPDEIQAYLWCFNEIGGMLDDTLGLEGKRVGGARAGEDQTIVWDDGQRHIALTLGHALGSKSLPLWISLRGNAPS